MVIPKLARFMKPASKTFLRPILFILICCIGKLSGQISIDTLNKYNSKNNKQGYWIFYMDSTFKLCEARRASHYGYVYFDNGEVRVQEKGRTDKNGKTMYKPFQENADMRKPVLLNGELFNYSLRDTMARLDVCVTYKNGRIAQIREYYDHSGINGPECATLYYDSLYNSVPNSFLYLYTDNNILLYKQYRGYLKPHEYTKRNYLVPHKEFKSLYSIILGGQGSVGKTPGRTEKVKNFAEIGFSKRFISGFFTDVTGRRYKDNELVYHALNFSTGVNLNKGKVCLAPKITYSFLLLFLRAEAGLVNYTDFSKNDLRATFGVGISVFGHLNEMIQFSVPLTQNRFTEISRLTVSMFIN